MPADIKLIHMALHVTTGIRPRLPAPVAPAQWQQQVYQPLIVPRMAELLRRPDYRY